MEPAAETLRMYGRPSAAGDLSWRWVEAELFEAGTYWVVAHGVADPHPRPVWGLWHEGTLALSVGSPSLARALVEGATVTVHLDSGAEVVIVEGAVVGFSSDEAMIRAYNRKYSWDYTVGEYGALTLVTPQVVRAWRSAGWAGQGGFRQTGRWRFAR